MIDARTGCARAPIVVQAGAMTIDPAAVDGVGVPADEFARLADHAPVPMWVSKLDRTRSYVNAAYLRFLGVGYDAALGFDWRARLHPDDAERIVQESIAGEARLETFALEARYRRGDGAWRWLHSTSQPRFDAAGRHIGFLGVAHDVTEAKRAIEAAEEREAQLAAVIAQTAAGFAQVDLDGHFTLVNERFCEIAGHDRDALHATTMQAITHPDDLPANLPLFEAAVREGTSYTHEKRYVRADGNHVWVNNSVAVIRRGDGTSYGVLAVTLDVTERRAAERRQALLIDELNHRVKNMLAVVQGIAQQTVRAGVDPVAAQEAFSGRLRALAAAHDLILMEGWAPVPFAGLVAATLAPHGGGTPAIRVEGPDFLVPPRTAVSLALAIHELATNAVKHGALSVPGGSVSLAWSIASGAVPRLRLDWRERGGPAVTAPSRRGFGSRMIERALASELGGTAGIAFERDGVACTVDAPLPPVDERGGAA